MQDNKRDMHKIDEALYFVKKKNNQVELTDNGIKYLLEIPIQTFVLPDIGTEIAYRKEKLDKDAEAEEKNNYFKISESKASVFIH
jgi:preprotein translocase subunit SecA